MGGYRRSTKSRGPQEIELALTFTVIWVGVAVWSFVPTARDDLTLFLVITLIAPVVWVVAIVRLRARLASDKSLEQLRTLSPDEFEEWVGARFRERGYRVRVTGMGGDHGADLLAEKPGELAIVQCKRYRTSSVGEPQLRDLFGAMHDFGAQHAYLVTTGRLTDPARAWARGKPITIWDGDDLAQMAKGAAPTAPVRSAPDAAAESRPAAAATPAPDSGVGSGQPTCPRCGGALVVRRNRQSGEPFLGCARFPQCRYTQRIESPGQG